MANIFVEDSTPGCKIATKIWRGKVHCSGLGRFLEVCLVLHALEGVKYHQFFSKPRSHRFGSY